MCCDVRNVNHTESNDTCNGIFEFLIRTPVHSYNADSVVDSLRLSMVRSSHPISMETRTEPDGKSMSKLHHLNHEDVT